MITLLKITSMTIKDMNKITPTPSNGDMPNEEYTLTKFKKNFLDISKKLKTGEYKDCICVSSDSEKKEVEILLGEDDLNWVKISTS